MRELRNIGASVRARLLNRARAEETDFEMLLVRYALERLLYRLSVSGQQEQFVLKGAMLLAVWQGGTFRPTRDLDLLGCGESDPAVVAASIRSLFAVAVPDDGVEFSSDGVKAAPIRVAGKNAGVRVRTTADIASARLPIQIDIGFGDAVSPGVITVEYPTLLEFPAPILNAIPPETVVAEKTDAIISLGEANSRMKDFYDLWLFAQTFTFQGAVLVSAFQRTFESRGTSWPEELPIGLGNKFALKKDEQWRTFLKSNRLGTEYTSFCSILEVLRAFLLPVLARSEIESWQPGGPWICRRTGL